MINTVERISLPRDIEQSYTPLEFATALRSLATRIEQGEPLQVEIAGETVVIPSDATFSVELEQEESEGELEFQIKWMVGDMTKTVEDSDAV
jgi:amphi-Trp domain-containing protein